MVYVARPCAARRRCRSSESCPALPFRMPISTSSKPKSGQCHQNKVAFKHNPSSKLTKVILASPIHGLCEKCMEKIQWRKAYRKYKPLTTPRKCVRCDLKNILDAYHVLCKNCGRKKQTCEKCFAPLSAPTTNTADGNEPQAALSELVSTEGGCVLSAEQECTDSEADSSDEDDD